MATKAIDQRAQAPCPEPQLSKQAKGHRLGQRPVVIRGNKRVATLAAISLIIIHLWWVEPAAAQNPADTPVPLLPVPDAATQAEASKRVQEVFGKEIAKAKQPAEKLQIARKLMDAGIAEQKDQSGRFALLKLAADTASAAGDFATATEAIDEMAKSHEIDGLKLKADSATTVSKAIRLPQQRKGFAVSLNAVVGKCISEDRYDLARQIAELALGQARLAEDVPGARAIPPRSCNVSGNVSPPFRI